MKWKPFIYDYALYLLKVAISTTILVLVALNVTPEFFRKVIKSVTGVED